MAVKCSRCDEAEAVLVCVDCDERFCEPCSNILHSKGKWKLHQLKKEIEDNAPTNPVESLSMSPPSPVFKEPLSLSMSPPSSWTAAGLSKKSRKFSPLAASRLTKSPSESPSSSPPPDSMAGKIIRKSASVLGTETYATQSHTSEPTSPIQIPSSNSDSQSNKNEQSSPSNNVAALRQKLGSSIPMSVPMPTRNKSEGELMIKRRTQRYSFAPKELEKAATSEDLQNQQSRPKYRFLSLHETTKNITWGNKRFPMSSTIGQIAQWSSKLVNGGKETISYAVYHNGSILDPEKFILMFPNIGEKDILELKEYKSTPLVVKITIPEFSSTISMRADEFTSVFSILQQAIKKIRQSFDWNAPEHYALYYIGDSPDQLVELKEDDFMGKYRDRLTNNLIYKRKDVKENLDLTIQVLFGEVLHVSFDSKESVESALRKFVKIHYTKSQGVLNNVFEYGFEIARDSGDEEDAPSIWLEESRTMGSYYFSGTPIEFTKRVKEFLIELPNGISFPLSFDKNSLVRDCLEFILHNHPELFDHVPPKEFNLCLKKDGTVLSLDRSLWSYEPEKDIVLKRKQYPIIVFLGQSEQRSLLVDFSVPVFSIMNQIWSTFSLPPQKQNEFSLRRLSPDVAIDPTKSLAAQDISHNTTIVIKFIQKQQEQETSAESGVSIETNIWQEPTNNSTILFESDTGLIRAATLNKLVAHLTPNSNPDLDYMKAFLMTFHSFGSPSQLLKKLIERYSVPLPAVSTADEMETWIKNTQRPIQLRVCNVLRYWLENHWQDFDHELTTIVVNFVDNLPNDQKTIVGKQLNKAVLNRTCGMKVREKTQLHIKGCPQPIIKADTFKRKNEPLTIFQFDELEVARQLTLIDFSYFEKILPMELLNQAWAKDKLKHRAMNVINFIHRFNNVGMWVANQIIDPTRANIRAKRWTFFIRVAEHLKNLNNFFGVMAFLSGFNNASVQRLKFTKNLLQKKSNEILADLDHLMNPNSSFKTFREALHKCTPPCIPHIGTYLTDLTFIDDGNPDYVNGNLINFTKWKLTYSVISELQRYQQASYQLIPVGMIQQLSKDLPSRDEKSLYDLSLAREPRNAERVA